MPSWPAILCLVVLFCLVVLAILIILRMPQYHRLTTMQDWSDRNRVYHSRYRDVLLRLCAVFDEHRICYWMHDGTLLGAVRHRGFVPYDDDIDLVVYRVEPDKFERLLERIAGLTIQRTIVGLRVWLEAGVPIDLFYFDGHDRIHGNPANERRYPTEFYYAHEVFPLRHDIAFEGLYLPCPRDPIAFCHRAYGPKSLEDGRITQFHFTASMSSLDVVLLFITRFYPKSIPLTAREHHWVDECRTLVEKDKRVMLAP